MQFPAKKEGEPPVPESRDTAFERAPLSPEAFIIAKTRYFSRLALQSMFAWRLHEQSGHMATHASYDRLGQINDQYGMSDAKSDLQRAGVANHTLVVMARVQELAHLAGLPEQWVNDACIAASVHDVDKIEESRRIQQALKSGASSWEAYEKAGSSTKAALLRSGVPEGIALVAGSVGHGSLDDMSAILSKEQLTDEDIARLCLHYVDDYTRGDQAVNPADATTDSNDLDRRMDMNEANPRYSVLNQEGTQHFNGRTTYQEQRRVGREVQQRLIEIIAQRTSINVVPRMLPEYIEAGITRRIVDSAVQ